MRKKYILLAVLLVVTVVVAGVAVKYNKSKPSANIAPSEQTNFSKDNPAAVKNWPLNPPAGTGLFYMKTIGGKAHEFYNGVDLDPSGSFGQISQQIAQDGHLAQVFLTHIGPPRYQIVYDGQIVRPDFDAAGYPEIAVSGNHFAYTDGGSTNATIFYDGKKIGYGNNLRLSGYHYAYTENISPVPYGETHVFYDGKDLGPCCNGRLGSASVSGDHLVYTGLLSKGEVDITYSSNPLTYISHVIVDGKDIGSIKATSWPQFSGNHMAYIKANGDLIYDDKKIAEKVRDVKLSSDNILYVTDDSDVYYNGKKLGQGNYIQLDGNDYVYLKMIKNFSQSEEPLCNIIFNGTDLGQSTECRVSLFKGNAVFQRVVNGSTHMILNGQDIGEGEGGQLIEPLKMQISVPTAAKSNDKIFANMPNQLLQKDSSVSLTPDQGYIITTSI